MANQQNANPETLPEEFNSITKLMENSVDSVNDLSIASLYSTATGKTAAGKYLRERATILRGLVNEVDRPLLKSFATDMINTMAGWFEDPEVLCCLINGIWTAYAEQHKMDQTKIPENLNLVIADTTFGAFLSTLISVIDFIIAFLTQDLKKLVFFIPDFIKEIFGTMMGAILLVLQEVLYILRDSVIQTVMDWVDENAKGDMTWAKCLPMQQFLDILKKYISDYGLLDDLMEKIRGFVSGKINFWNKAKDIIPNAKDLEFLYWLRDLLVKLKQAVVNFDLCVEYAFVPDNTYVSDEIVPDTTRSTNASEDIGGSNDKVSNAQNIVPIVVSDDGKTILLSDTDSRTRNGSSGTRSLNNSNNNGTYQSRLSNNSVVNFIKTNYGFSNDVVEQAMMRMKDGCDGFPGGTDLKNYLNKIRNRK